MNLRSGRVVSSLVAFALVAGAIAGCTTPLPPQDGGDAGPSAVELGTGQLDWESLAVADPTVELIYGAQGGFHVWGRARFRLEPDVDVTFRVVRVSDGLELHRPTPVRRWIEDGVRYGIISLQDGRYQTDAELVVLTLDCARDLVGQQLRIDVFVRERRTGRIEAAQRTVRVTDEIPSPPGCLSERDGNRSDTALTDASVDSR